MNPALRSLPDGSLPALDGPIDAVFLGDVVTEDRVIYGGVVAAAGGKIVAVGTPDRVELLRSAATETYDFAGRLLLPGFVDAHVHSFSGPGEGWERSSLCAAVGGVTTIIEMPYDAAAPVVHAERFRQKRESISGSTLVDVALLATIQRQDGVPFAEEMIDEGACGFKVSLFETDPVRFPRISSADLLELLQICARRGTVVGFHAEDTEIIDAAVARARAAAPTDPLSHPRSRPPVAENVATAIALQLGRDTGCPVHIYHASLASATDLVRSYRAAGADVSVETCPHYLLLEDADMRQLGARGKINPPLRAAEQRSRLWERLQAGDIDMLSSDHAPWPLSRKSAEVIFDNASGTPGVDLLGPLMLGTGYLGGKLSLLHTVRMLATAPARRFGLGSSKGTLAVGLDADLVAYDPSARTRITAAASHSSAGWSPYEGYEIPGRITATFVRGTRVYADGVIVAGLGHGRFVRPSVLSAVSA